MTDPRHSLAISLAQYALDLRSGHPDAHATASGACGRCDAMNRRGVWLRHAGEVYCPVCAPLRRSCSACGGSAPIEQYSVNTKRMTLDTLCPACRREKGRRQYATAQALQRDIASTGVCSTCGETKRRFAFYVDKRYASGLSSRCRKCQNSANAEYQRLHPRTK
jgi:hypothetical protein